MERETLHKNQRISRSLTLRNSFCLTDLKTDLHEIRIQMHKHSKKEFFPQCWKKLELAIHRELKRPCNNCMSLEIICRSSSRILILKEHTTEKSTRTWTAMHRNAKVNSVKQVSSSYGACYTANINETEKEKRKKASNKRKRER